MIPVALPSLEFVLIRLAFVLATLFWLGWTLRLCLSASARQRLSPRRTMMYAASAVLGVYTLVSFYQLQRHVAESRAAYDASFRLTLTKPRVLGAIEMPAGTALELAIAHRPDAFSTARFPHPVQIGGVSTLTARRYLAIHTDEAHRTTGYTPINIRLEGQGHGVLLGWVCDAAQPIIFATHPDGGVGEFQSCTLAEGNHIENIPLPQGAELIATTGTVYPDGRVDPDRWLIHLPTTSELHIGGSLQRGGAILLDADRKLYRRVP